MLPSNTGSGRSWRSGAGSMRPASAAHAPHQKAKPNRKAGAPSHASPRAYSSARRDPLCGRRPRSHQAVANAADAISIAPTKAGSAIGTADTFHPAPAR